AVAVARLIAGLIQYGEKVSVAPQVLNALRDNLNFMRSFIGTEPVESKVVAGQIPRKSFASILFWRRTKTFENRAPQRYRKFWTALALLVTVASVSVAYFEFDQLRLFWPKLPWGAPALPSAETMPPVGTGQHLAV